MERPGLPLGSVSKGRLQADDQREAKLSNFSTVENPPVMECRMGQQSESNGEVRLREKTDRYWEESALLDAACLDALEVIVGLNLDAFDSLKHFARQRT